MTAPHVVGPKGQVVIEKAIRDRLGIEPGWIALQRVVKGRVELTFLPPEHRESLKGSLADHIAAPIPADLRDARERAWRASAAERVDTS